MTININKHASRDDNQHPLYGIYELSSIAAIPQTGDTVRGCVTALIG